MWRTGRLSGRTLLRARAATSEPGDGAARGRSALEALAGRDAPRVDGGEHRGDLGPLERVGHGARVGVDGERDPDDAAVGGDDRRARVAGGEPGGEHEHVAGALAFAVDVGDAAADALVDPG